MQARRKLEMGVPLAAVHAEMKKRDLDPSLLELDAAHPLPLHLQVHPVMLEFTEVYLDEPAFMAHASSREYLDGYGKNTSLCLLCLFRTLVC